MQAEIRGAGLIQHPKPAIVTWGTSLQVWPIDGGKRRTVLAGRNFGPGGCVADVDGDGRDDLLVQERPGVGRFLWLKAPDWAPKVVEQETDFGNCLPFTLEGKRGVLLQHLNSQIRFYLFPNFEYKELYSIYTASEQGGLLAHDVDGDGLEDLFVGNYWMKNPGRLDVAWRLYAINVWHETPTAARAALGIWQGRQLFWAESKARHARVAIFTPPGDVKQLWQEERLAELDRPAAILVQTRGVYLGHAGGVDLESPDGRGGWTRTRISRNEATVQLIGWKDRVFAISPAGVYPLK